MYFVVFLQSFWGYVNALLDSILKGAPSGVATHCKDVHGFAWWLITHLAQLGKYNRNGVLQNEVRHGQVVERLIYV